MASNWRNEYTGLLSDYAKPSDSMHKDHRLNDRARNLFREIDTNKSGTIEDHELLVHLPQKPRAEGTGPTHEDRPDGRHGPAEPIPLSE